MSEQETSLRGKYRISLIVNCILIISLIVFYINYTKTINQATTSQKVADATKDSLLSRFVTAKIEKFNVLNKASLSQPVELKFAKELTKNFRASALASAMKKEDVTIGNPEGLYFKHMFFDESTLATFADLYKNKKIDGLRIYLGKYNNAIQPYGNNYTFILVGTKAAIDSTKQTIEHIDVTSILSANNTTILSIQNFGDPCPPRRCLGDEVGQP